MSIRNKYWYKLLTHFDQKNYFQNGLTLPFIIGSRHYLEPREELQTIYSLICEFSNSNYFINVLECDIIGEYVFRISNKEDKNMYGGFGNLVFSDFYSLNKYKNIEDFKVIMSGRYSELIELKKYSKNYGIWDYYIEIDTLRIKELIIE